MTYQVIIDDNFHYMDPEHQRVGPRFATLEEAVAYCRRVVDEFLIENYRFGMPSYELLTQYLLYGEDPFVRGGEGGVPFSARDYAGTWIREVYGEWQFAVCNRDKPLLSRLIATALAPVVRWRIGRRLHRSAAWSATSVRRGRD